MLFYSKSTNGFYKTEIHGTNIPSDAVSITQDQYDALLNGQSNHGKKISSDENGFPILVEQDSGVLSYTQQRMYEYPKLEDFVDAYYWSLKGNTTLMDAYISKCDVVKQKYPKE